MSQDRMQLQRHELKYRISEDVALGVREFVSSYLEIDEFGATRPNLSYPVHSLYLDSPDLLTYRHTINGNKNRYKLRIRFYDNRPNAPVYLEIKRRMDNAILKQRGAIRRGALDSALAGQFPAPADLASNDPRHLAGIQRFIQTCAEIQARPTAHVAYLREAWISPHDNSVRVTMDRDVRLEPEPSARLEAAMTDPVQVFENMVILELKFTGRFPDWWRELVRVFGLEQNSAAKYADGIAMYGESRLKDSVLWGAQACTPSSGAPPGTPSTMVRVGSCATEAVNCPAPPPPA